MKALRLLVVFWVALGLLVPQSAVLAQDNPACVDGEIVEGCPVPEGGLQAEAAAGFKLVYSKALKGGYVAHGVGMRNTGFGAIEVDDVPPGSKVSKAYLFWAVIGPAKMTGFNYAKGRFNGALITGSLVGAAANPNWATAPGVFPPLWAYRADVTAKVAKTGNGTYNLTDFASGLTNGANPFGGTNVPPLFEGATLVIVYSNANSPTTTVKIFNGAATTSSVDAWQLHLNVTGINATVPTGLSQATFIGADGQSTAETGSAFFTNALGSVAWDGLSVPNGAGANYPQGNLWDTHTVDLTYLIDPPEPEFWFTTQGGDDSLVWVAQVVSYASGKQDTDGDKLLDGWELFGVDGVDLPGYGADPMHKDLFIEADYMNGHDHLLDLVHLQDIVAVFADAPVLNPDGTTGINIHIDTGGAATGAGPGTHAQFNLGGGNAVPEDTFLGTTLGSGDYNWAEFQAIKDANFDPDRQGLFHYMIFAHNLAPEFGTVSGLSRNATKDSQFVKGASDFIVSMGDWSSGGTQDQREGTFIHELGHNLGLRHGGNDHGNWKPHYLSVMNYYYQTWGVFRDGDWGHYDYSRFLSPTLKETALNETTGLGPVAAGYGLRWWCTNLGDDVWADQTAPVDWNCDDNWGGVVRADINGDGRLTTLASQNNWASITFAGGGLIGAGVSSGQSLNALTVTRTPLCLTYEDALRVEEILHRTPGQ
ncbi:MAG TPA: hypothetical protein VIO36_12145 [Anaerolineaceae bacterium]